MNQQVAPANLTALANRLNIDVNEANNIVLNTIMKAKNNAQASPEEVVTFLAIANEYNLNPLTKEIYAFPSRGGIQPIVSIDGWLKIINSHPQFDGMEFQDNLDNNGGLLSVTCRIYRKDRTKPTEVTEYLSECQDKTGKSEPWKKWPARMLRHKATIQCARYAFGFSGIVDPDEAERIKSSEERTERDVTPQSLTPEQEQNWQNAKKAYKRDGSLDSVKKRVDISPEHEQQLINEVQSEQNHA